MPKNMTADQKKDYARYLSLFNTFLGDITPEERERLKAEMISIENILGIVGDWN